MIVIMLSGFPITTNAVYDYQYLIGQMCEWLDQDRLIGDFIKIYSVRCIIDPEPSV